MANANLFWEWTYFCWVFDGRIPCKDCSHIYPSISWVQKAAPKTAFKTERKPTREAAETKSLPFGRDRPWGLTGGGVLLLIGEAPSVVLMVGSLTRCLPNTYTRNDDTERQAEQFSLFVVTTF